MVNCCKICGFVFQNNITPIVCPFCGAKTEITDEDIIKRISSDNSFIDAMTSLKEKDPVEYQLKIGQFKTQLQQQDNMNSQKQQSREEESVPKCPHCGSTTITAGQRGYSFILGFIGSGNTVNRCSKCGHRWKPSK